MKKIVLEICDPIQKTTQEVEDFTSFGTIENAVANLDDNELYDDCAIGFTFDMVCYDDEEDVAERVDVTNEQGREEFLACERVMELVCHTYFDEDILQAMINCINSDELTINYDKEGNKVAWYLSQDADKECAVYVGTLKRLTEKELAELADANGCGY